MGISESDPLICRCHKVKQSTIVEAIAAGADSVEKIGAMTQAGTGCGNCRVELEKLLQVDGS